MAKIPECTGKIAVLGYRVFGLDLVQRYHEKLGLPPNPSALTSPAGAAHPTSNGAWQPRASTL